MSRAEPSGRAATFAALGDPTRLSLVTTLADGNARSIASLAADTALTRQAVTKHLHVLEQAGLVSSARVGRESQFAFRPEPVLALSAWLDGVARQWDEALARLRSLVEE